MSATERRRRRSNDPTEAIRYQLDACRRTAGLDAMILADQDGLCIAASGPAPACEELAARSAMLAARHSAARGLDTELWTDDDRWAVHVRRFDLDGSALCLCAVGGDPGGRATEVERSLRGVTRILAA